MRSLAHVHDASGASESCEPALYFIGYVLLIFTIDGVPFGWHVGGVAPLEVMRLSPRV